jgi:hypothetical protein
LGNDAIGNIFQATENATNFVFGDNLRNVTIKAGNYPAHPTMGTLNLTAGGYAFLYNKDYPSEIFVGANGAALHSYYDAANNRYVVTNLVTLLSINSGTVTSVNAGTNISVTGTAAAPIINSLSDRYKTTSTTSNTIGNGSRTFTVDANLSYIPLQEVLIVYDVSNHMHGEVTSYNSTTGQLIVDVQHHTGSGTFASWVINLDGTPVDAITGAGTANRLAYFTATQVIDDVAAITANRVLISDANGLPTHSSITDITLGYLDASSSIQTQLNGKQGTITLTTTGTSGAATLSGATLNIPQYSGGSSALSFTRPGASYTLLLTDAGKVIEMDITNTANTLTVPLGSGGGPGEVLFPLGTVIHVIQRGSGQTTISPVSGGVTLNSSGGWLKLAAQYSAATLLKVNTNEWYVFGQLAP